MTEDTKEPTFLYARVKVEQQKGIMVNGALNEYVEMIFNEHSNDPPRQILERIDSVIHQLESTRDDVLKYLEDQEANDE